MQEQSKLNYLQQYRSQILAIVIWVVVGLSANAYMRVNNLTIAEFADELGHLLMDNWYGPLLYIGVYFLRPLTFFPGTPLTMMAGYLYGLQWGMGYALIAGLVSTALPYSAGRWFSDENQLKRRLKDRNTRMVSVVRMMRDNPFQTVLTTRFLYLPYDLVNFVAGSLHIPFDAFIAATALGNAISSFIMVSIGASLGASFETGQFSVDPVLIMFSAMIWFISLGINRYLKRNDNDKENHTI